MLQTSIRIAGISFPVIIIRSKRKTLALSVSSDCRVIARAPLKMPEYMIGEFIVSKAEWIEKRAAVIEERNKQLEGLEHFSADQIKAMADEAGKIIPERVKYYASLIGVTYGRITIRNQKTRWGSCSAKGNLNFNCLLVKAPSEVLDAVVVHELCHRKHMDHSKEFYNEIYKVYPEYDQWDSWLKDNGRILVGRMI